MKEKLLAVSLLYLALVACASNKAADSGGDKIVLNVYRGDELVGKRLTYVINTDGTGEVDWELPPNLVDDPEWSADGQWVVFSTAWAQTNRGEIYLMRSNGSQRIQIANGANATWSPNGFQLAYSYDNGLYVLDVDCYLHNNADCSPRPKFLTEGDTPSWSPDGNFIAYFYSHSHEIRKATVAGTIATINLEGGENCIDPQWSPEGSKIAVWCDDGIRILYADGSGSVDLTEGYGLKPAWSPDGKHIVFVAGKKLDDNLGQPIFESDNINSKAIFIMDSDGKNVKRLSPYNDEMIFWFAWLPVAAQKQTP